ncbi:hypothetical protein B0H21DRAFT_711749 [Amylocystis lapponica]|nr:hypothetical protein B0H21DRAFT_711749 [Amylocystis lapponica]
MAYRFPQPRVNPTSNPIPGPRTRVVEHQWLRDPDGPILPRPPPLGIRTPSGIIWGHSLDDFMWIQRVPGVDVMTIWSRSMVKELGERYDEAQFEHPEPLPRRRRPWPDLGRRAARRDGRGLRPRARRLQSAQYSIRGDPFEDDEADDRPEMDLSLRRPFDENDLKLTVPNASKVMSPLGVPYVRLWVPEFGSNFTKVREMGVVDEFVLIGHDLKTGLARAANEVGMVDVFVENRPSGDEAGSSEKDTKDAGNGDTATSSVAAQDTLQESLTVGNTDANVETPEGDIIMPLENENLNTAIEVATEVTQPTAEESLEISAAPMDLDTSAALPFPVSQEVSEQASNEVTMLLDEVAPQVDASSTSEDSSCTADATRMDVDSSSESSAETGTSSRSTGAGTTSVRRGSSDSGPKGKTTKTNGAQNAKFTDDPDLYSVKDLPKLEEFIPEQFFPDYLMVHRAYRVDPITKYKRIFPKLARDTTPDGKPQRIAELYLSDDNRLGTGNHSVVRRAALTLPAPLSARSRTKQVTVAAKSAFAIVSARKFLRHEASKYAMFPKHLQEEFCGYNIVPPMQHPVPAGAVVPKFYGYYVPVDDDGKPEDEAYANREEEDESKVDGLSPVLLMEECGEPIKPAKFTLDARSECYSLILRLHYAGFTQGSLYVRNVVVQPGPLTIPPEERSMVCPSYRIIDFGRAEHWTDQVDEFMGVERRRRKRRDWWQWLNGEEARAQRELAIPDWDF